MVKKKRIGRPPGRTYIEAFIVKTEKGTLARWRRAARHEGLTVAGLIRQSVADRITRTKTKKGTSR